MPDYELVRVARTLVDELLQQESNPVVLVGLERRDDGTCDMLLRTPELEEPPIGYRVRIDGEWTLVHPDDVQVLRRGPAASESEPS